MIQVGQESLLAKQVLSLIQSDDNDKALEAARNLSNLLLGRHIPRPAIRMAQNIDGEPQKMAQIRVDGSSGAIAHVEQLSYRGKAKTSVSISCPSLGSGSSPDDARAMAYALLAIADAAETIVSNLNQGSTS